MFEVKALYLQPDVKLDDAAMAQVAAAIQRCADWHATPKVKVTRTSPAGLRMKLRSLLAQPI